GGAVDGHRSRRDGSARVRGRRRRRWPGYGRSGSRPGTGASGGARWPTGDRGGTGPRNSRLRLVADVAMRLVALRQVKDHSLDALVDRRLPRETELEEDRVDDLLDRSLAQKERVGDCRVVLPLGHLAQHIPFARRQMIERRVLGT